MAVCHSVIVDPRTRKYMASSPDELALVEGAKDQGFTFVNRDAQKIITLLTPDGELEYELLNVLEFTSFRKRMSVIVRDL